MSLLAENNPHLQMPKSIDFGLCPRGGEISVTYSKTAVFTNKSDEDIYLVNSWMKADYSIDKYGQYGFIFFPYGFPQAGSPPVVVGAKKSIQISVWFDSFDTGDTGAIDFNAKIIILSRTSPEFPRYYKDLYRDTLYLHATAVDSQKISGSYLDYHEGKGCTYFYEQKYESQYNVNFINTLTETVVLDSLHTVSDGPSKPQWVKAVKFLNTEIPLPVDVPSRGRMLVGAFFSTNPFGENRVVITGYFTGKDTKKHYTADAVLNLRDTLLQEARFYSKATFFESDDGKPQVEKGQVYLYSCSSESMWADSIVVTSEWERDEVKVTSGVITFPFLLDPSEEYRLDITYTPKTRGRQFGFVKAYFHTNDGRQIVRTLDFQTYFPDSVSSVGEIREDSHATPSLLITEPNLPLKLLGTYLDTPKLYDSYGNFIDLSARLEQDYISLEGLSSGVYCFVFNSPVGMVSRKVLYVR